MTAWLGMALSFWVVSTTVYGFWYRLRNKNNKVQALLRTPAAFWGMSLAHVGIAIVTVGITLTSIYADEQQVRMAPGDSYRLSDSVEFTFNNLSSRSGQNYNATVASITVHEGNRQPFEMRPEKRVYPVRGDVMTEAAIDGGIRRDLFVALGDALPDGRSWSFRLQKKPFVSWIWIGAVFMAFGALLGAADGRYRHATTKARSSKKNATPAPPIAARISQ
jgi:cytochrome c-type biogenesis protein CcmF